MAQRQQQPIISGLIIVGLAMLLVAVQFTSDLHSPTLFIIKAGAQLITLILLIASLGYAALVRRKLTTLAVFIACVINAPFLLPSIDTATANQSRDTELVVATFSTLTRTLNVDDIIAFTLSENPDLLCLQELSQEHRTRLLEGLQGHYAYHRQNNNNQITLSRYPLLADGGIGHYQGSKLEHPVWGDINIINTHMPRPYLTAGLGDSWKKLLKHLDTSSNTILCGDLNITPNNSLYDVLRYQYNLNDALRSGYGFTYPNAERRSALFGPLIRIDYILTRGIKASNTRTLNVSNRSDHRAVLTHLTLSEL